MKKGPCIAGHEPKSKREAVCPGAEVQPTAVPNFASSNGYEGEFADSENSFLSAAFGP